ncbi:MAG: UTP--glucose-1-phosphate uridylyltransferase [Candidatus Sericytochromatia bacterium]|nr:UTP--glucose-1-phosphate uridylyltransferase [Candidatus Tanganyikabacteria bacterium]
MSIHQTFEKLVARYRSGAWKAQDNILTAEVTAPLPGDIATLPPDDTSDRRELERLGQEALRRGELGLVILAGGMATRFAWDKPKGLFPIYQATSFLGWKITWAREICGERLPIHIMTSFHTHEAIREHLEEHDFFGHDPASVHLFQQYRFRRLTPDGTFFDSPGGQENDAAPGHGDFADALRTSGLLGRFLSGGGRVILFSNVDNLGATPDLAIVGYHLQTGAEMTAEVAAKAKGDKGGAPARVGGRLQLVEGFAFPPGFDQDSVPVFNTATYCFDARALDREFDLPWYVVEKSVEGQSVIQFEHLAGDLSCTLATRFLAVDRDDRFIPVKSQADVPEAQARIARKAERLSSVLSF